MECSTRPREEAGRRNPKGEVPAVFIQHTVNKYLWNMPYVPDSLPGAKETAANMGVCGLVEKTVIKPVNVGFTYT